MVTRFTYFMPCNRALTDTNSSWRSRLVLTWTIPLSFKFKLNGQLSLSLHSASSIFKCNSKIKYLCLFRAHGVINYRGHMQPWGTAGCAFASESLRHTNMDPYNHFEVVWTEMLLRITSGWNLHGCVLLYLTQHFMNPGLNTISLF